MRWSWQALLGLGVLSLAAGSTPAVQERDDGGDLISVEARDGGIEVEKLLAIAAEVTGEPFFYEPEALHGLRAQPTGLTSIPRRRLMPYLEDQLRVNDLVSFEATVAGVRCHTVLSFRSTHRPTSIKTDADYVPPERLPEITDRDEIVTSYFTFRSQGVASGFQHAVCYRFSDSATASIRLIQGTGSYIVTGSASNVAQTVALMKRLDAANLRNDLDDDEAKYVESMERRITVLESALAGR